MNDSVPEPRYLDLSAEIVSAHVAHSAVPTDTLPNLIQTGCFLGCETSGSRSGAQSAFCRRVKLGITTRRQTSMIIISFTPRAGCAATGLLYMRGVQLRARVHAR